MAQTRLRHNTGNFNETQPFAAPEFSNSADAIEISDPIPCVLEQGISEAITGKEIFRTGNLDRPALLSTRSLQALKEVDHRGADL
jgi:hypothetical protein